jgi:hypothetical protein
MTDEAFAILIVIAVILFIVAIAGYLQTSGGIVRVGDVSNTTPPWVWATTIIAVIIFFVAIYLYIV